MDLIEEYNRIEKLRKINGDAHASTRHRIETRLRPRKVGGKAHTPRKYAITDRVL
jgi:hypothetical protein